MTRLVTAAAMVALTAGLAPSAISMGALPPDGTAKTAPAGVETAPRATLHLRHNPTGFRANAPSGFRLRFRSGVYTIENSGTRLTLLKIRNATDPRAVARDLLRDDLRLRSIPTAKSRSQFAVALTSQGRRAEAHFLRARGGVVVAGMAPRLRRVGGRLIGPKRLTRGQLQTLTRIANSASGLRARRLGGTTTVGRGPTLALRSYTNPDGSARSSVPRGWDVSGGAGQITGVEPGHRAAFSFGAPFLLIGPGTVFAISPGPGQHVQPFRPPREAVTETIPAIWSTPQNQLGNVQIRDVVSEDPSQGLYVISLTSNGQPWDGLIYVAVAPPNPSLPIGTSFLYTSFGTVRRGAGPEVANSVLRAWETWDPSVDQARRRQQTIRSLIVAQAATTNAILAATEFRQAAFERTNLKWAQYLRGDSSGAILPFTQRQTGLRVQPASNRVVLLPAA